MQKEFFIEAFRKKLEGKEFCLPTDLVKVGIFAHLDECRRALRRGDIPFIRITRNRFLIPIEPLLKHLEESIINANKI